jgi:RNA polymerase primary sigma factor
MECNGILEEGLFPRKNEQDSDSLDVETDPGDLELKDVEEIEGAEIEEEVGKTAVVEHFDDAIKLYLREIQKTKLLTADEEKELAVKISLGDTAARDRMIVSNLRLVVKIAKRYINRTLPLLDLIGEGNMGLIKAVDRFKVSKECRFSTYATWWIRQTIERSLLNQSRTVRLPVNISDDINKMLRVTRELVCKLNREPTIKEVADTLEVEAAYVRRLMLLSKKTYSFERSMEENGDFSLLDTIEDTSNVSSAALIEDLNKYEQVSRWFETLSLGEKKILTLRFGLDDKDSQTLDTIGRSFGLTRERIRQIEAKALGKLRNCVEEGSSHLADYQEKRDLKKLRSYTPEFRAEVVKLTLAHGLTQETAAKRFAIPKGTLSNWMKATEDSGCELDPRAHSVSDPEAELRLPENGLSLICLP